MGYKIGRNWFIYCEDRWRSEGISVNEIKIGGNKGKFKNFLNKNSFEVFLSNGFV